VAAAVATAEAARTKKADQPVAREDKQQLKHMHQFNHVFVFYFFYF